MDAQEFRKKLYEIVRQQDLAYDENTSPIDYRHAVVDAILSAMADAWDQGHSQALANVAWPLERKGNPYRAQSDGARA